MKAILYLWRTTLKNQIKDLKNHPSKLIAYLFFIALIIFVFVTSNIQSDSGHADNLRSISELGAIIFALFMFLFISQVYQGLSSGSTFFKMSDVNLLFVSPISPKKVLVYGLVRQMGTSLFISIFILFQAGTLKQFYGVNGIGVIIIFIGYFLLTFMGSIVSMVIYSITSGSEKKKKVAKALIYILILPIIISILFNLNEGTIGIEAIVNGINSKVLEFIPFAGWIKALVYRLLTGETTGSLLYIIITVVGIILTVFILLKSKNEYYEDVLDATETMHKLKADAKDGRIVNKKDTKKIKLKNAGINKGQGATVFFFKHLVENKRSGKLFCDNATIVQLLTAVVFTLVMKNSGVGIISTFGMTTYIQLFMTFAGRWVNELKLHYIYLIPEKPLKKLLYAISESILKCFVDGVIIFIIVGIIFGSSPIDIIVCILARMGFGILFIAGDVLSQRVFKQVISKGLLMFLSFLILILIAVPGIIGAAIVGTIWNLGIISIMITFIWNVLISFIIIWACKNILDNIEQNSI